MTSYAAHLRVYEPLAAFEEPERAQWAAYAAAGSAVPPEVGVQREHAAGLAALAGPGPARLPDAGDHAYVLEVGGSPVVCPWRTGLRSLEALAEARAELPDALLDAAVPPAVLGAAQQALHAERTAHPGRRSHVLTSCWQVPVRWFVLFDSSEREVRSGTPGAPGPGGAGPLPGGAPAGRRTGRRLVYRTAMSSSRRRVARALAVLRRTVDERDVTGGLEDLGRWLEDFHPRSLVELDYGGLVHLQDDAALEGDESARDVAVALAALGEGRVERATAAYGRVVDRMKAMQAVESAN